jgi:phospholipid/cholesterol/gamma-HCH transport system permease protein
MNFLARIGLAVRCQLVNMGIGARLLWRLLGLMGPALRRPRLIGDQIHFLGNYSLAIIGVSGLFVGFVLGLQGYYILQRYGSAEALGMMVALSLLRELGPWSRPCCSRVVPARPDGRNRPDEGRRAAVGHGDDGGGPRQTHSGAALLGRADHHAFAGCGLQRRRRAGRLAGGRGDDRRRQRCFLGPDAAGVDWWSDLGNGVLKSFVFGLAVTFVALLEGYAAKPTPEGFPRHHPHRGRGFAGGAGSGLPAHRNHVQHLRLHSR